MDEKLLKSLELDKILSIISSYATLEASKKAILKAVPFNELNSAKAELDKTQEAFKLLYRYNLSPVSFFEEITDELLRAKKGGVLSCSELLRVKNLLKSSYKIKSETESIQDEDIIYFKQAVTEIYTDYSLQEEISSKILSDDEISDNASPDLFKIRKQIIATNEKIKTTLNSFIKKGSSEFLRENLITLRNGRYVVPVKSEYKNEIKGFVHDQSASGATVFIEPEQVIKLNNDITNLYAEEKREIHKILSELSAAIGSIAENLEYNISVLITLDMIFARAIYSFKNKCTKPKLNDRGYIKIINGRHPLIDKEKVKPISLSLGQNYNYLLITGPNTGGKTVTLKLTGLLTLMATCGIFTPTDEESEFSVFENIFSDIGDEQSIEQSLSTFSSHIKNIKEITDNLTPNSLVLIDEIGAGTDPEEGAALALSVLKYLLAFNSFGIVTTHYSRLKEFAMTENKIENASMDFNPDTYEPLYRLNIGIAGSSNAIEISKRLGINDNIISNALSYLSASKISFEKVLREAEKSRQSAEELKAQLALIEKKKKEELLKIENERKRLENELEKLRFKTNAQVKRIIEEKNEEADEIIEKMSELLNKDVLNISDVIEARKLKKQLTETYFDEEIDLEETEAELIKADPQKLKVNEEVFVKSINTEGIIKSLKLSKNEAEVLVGEMVWTLKLSDLYYKILTKQKPKNERKNKQNNVVHKISRSNELQRAEINILGQTVADGITSVEQFIAQAAINGYDEVKIIHGNGTGALRKGIRNYLKTNKLVEEFRSGVYGEGEQGVTFVKLKK